MKAILFIFLVLILASCGDQQIPEDVQPDTAVMNSDLKRLRSEVIFHDSVVVGPMVTRTVTRTIESSGRISLPPNGMHTLHSTSEGYVGTFHLIPGDAVSRGALLFTVSHPGIVEKQRLLLETAAERDLARKDLSRKEELIRSNATSAVAFEEASARAGILEARYQGLRAELELRGVDVKALLDKGEFQSEIRILSPVRGIIDEIYVHPGQMVSPNDPLVSIVNRSNMHIELQVLARHAADIKPGQKVTFTLPGQQDRLTAKVIQVNAQLNPDTETLNVHADPENHNLPGLIPGMFVRAQVELDNIPVTGLPEEAVVQQDGIYYVYGLDDQYIVKEALSTFKKVGNMVEIDSLPYQEFILKGAYYME